MAIGIVTGIVRTVPPPVRWGCKEFGKDEVEPILDCGTEVEELRFGCDMDVDELIAAAVCCGLSGTKSKNSLSVPVGWGWKDWGVFDTTLAVEFAANSLLE